jgi:Tol biopolymer transport system component
MRGPVARTLLVAATALLPSAGRGASYPPEYRFRSLVGARVTVHFQDELETMARRALPLAEQVLAAHERRYAWKVARVHVVLADNEDDPNAFATPLPYPLVRLRAAAPDGSDAFGNYEGWLRLVLTHELAHIVHLDQARGVPGFGRKLLGRAPYLFPNGLTPIWMIEGLATYEETEGTAFGRGRDPDARMVLRMAALEGRFPAEDVAAVFPDLWPQGYTPYLFGEAFLRDVSEHYGGGTLRDLASVHSRRVIPFTDDWTAGTVTGASFHSLWRDWAARSGIAAREQADGLRASGLSPSRALTAQGVRQEGPRYSPDGEWIAYSSSTLTRYRTIRVVRRDGSGARQLCNRNGGAALAWTPDGRGIVFDEPEVHDLFAQRSDLRLVDVASGRVRPLTRGGRARDPDLSPDGRWIAFVRRHADRSELALVPLAGGSAVDLTLSPPGTQWSAPHFSPNGAALVAARWTEGGALDLATVDVPSGAVSPLTADPTREVEPFWTSDGSHIVFRSDRDGISNLYALRLADRALLRVTRVLGGAFSPAVSPDGTQLAFARYASGGFDVHVMDVDWAVLPPAGEAAAAPASARPLPEPERAEARPYRPLPALLPRFWTPLVLTNAGEWLYGVATGGIDPLVRHAYELNLYRGSETGSISAAGFYQYDRFLPTLFVSARDTKEPATIQDAAGRLRAAVERTQEVGVRATVPIARSFRHSQSLSFAWRFRRESFEDVPEAGLDLGGVEIAWALSSARRYAYSVTPVEGWRLRLGWLGEDPVFGSDLTLNKMTADVRTYLRLLGEEDGLALRLGAGATVGAPEFRRSFAVGGFPDGGSFDVVAPNFAVLRGYPDDAFRGRHFAVANAEWRIPLAHPQRGWRSLPAFARHLHAAVFVDAASAWNGSFRVADVKTGVGAALGADFIFGHALPLTLTAGVGRGLSTGGETRGYFQAGLAF